MIIFKLSGWIGWVGIFSASMSTRNLPFVLPQCYLLDFFLSGLADFLVGEGAAVGSRAFVCQWMAGPVKRITQT